MKSYYMRIAVKDIRLNPTNPRRARTPEMVDRKAASLKANGQLSPVKLRPTTAEERVSDPTTYLLLGGELRYLAAKKLGWEALDALVSSVTPEEADLVALMDNKGEDMHWLDWYQAIEKWVLTHPDQNQWELAGQFEIDQSTISRALKTLQFLNQASRELIYAVSINSESEKDSQIGKKVALVLSDLEDPNKVKGTLKVAIDHKLTESKAKSLVHWIKAGNSPESYDQKTQANPSLDVNDPNAGLWKDLPADVVKVKWTPKGYVIRFVAAPSEGPALVYGALANLEYLKGQAREAENTRYRDSLKQVMEDGCAARAEEKNKKAQREENRLAVKKAKEAQAAQKAEAKAQAAAVREQARSARLQAKAQTGKAAQESLEDHKVVIQQKVEAVFGAGLLSDSLVQKGHSGNVRGAMKLAKTVLAQTGKAPEEQKAFLQDFRGDLKRHTQLMKKAGVALAGKTSLALSPAPESQSAMAPTPQPVKTFGPAASPEANPSFFGKIKHAVEESLNVTPESITRDLLKNIGRTADYEERKGMRKLFNDLI